MGRWQRSAAHFLWTWRSLRSRFPPALLDELATAIAADERRHLGELRLAIESHLPPLAAWRGLNASARAREAFARLRVWDTEHNNGVLVYVLMAERRVEIVADRGLAARVTEADWAPVCAAMAAAYARGDWRGGSLAGVRAVGDLLTVHFPSGGAPRAGELPDRPVLL